MRRVDRHAQDPESQVKTMSDSIEPKKYFQLVARKCDKLKDELGEMNGKPYHVVGLFLVDFSVKVIVECRHHE